MHHSSLHFHFIAFISSSYCKHNWSATENYRCFVEFDNLLLVLLVLWSSKQCTFYDNTFELPIFNWFHSSLWNIIIVCISTEFCFHKCLSMKIHFWRMFLFTTCCKFTAMATLASVFSKGTRLGKNIWCRTKVKRLIIYVTAMVCFVVSPS